jgi:hypothetical protein
VRERLRSEGERVNREIADYADLARATITSMTAISGRIRECKLAQETNRCSVGASLLRTHSCQSCIAFSRSQKLPSGRENGRDYIRWCFADLASAVEFAEKFGGGQPR